MFSSKNSSQKQNQLVVYIKSKIIPEAKENIELKKLKLFIKAFLDIVYKNQQKCLTDVAGVNYRDTNLFQ